jgi:hypothetical protein
VKLRTPEGILSRVTDAVAESMTPLIRAYHRSSAVEQDYYRSVIDRMVRHLEYFVVPGVSVAAQALAEEQGLGDLRLRPWEHKKTRQAVKWEHHPPVADLLKRLFALTDPEPSDVQTILMFAGVNWITREEDKTLPRYNRGHDLAAPYQEISMLHECRRD